MKAVSRDQATALIRRFGLVDFGKLDHDRLQSEVLDMPEDEFVRRATQFVASGCRLVIKGQSALILDRAKIPTLTQFIGKGWDAIEHDDRSLALTEIDFSKAVFGCPLREGESSITGEEKLIREKLEPHIRLDYGVGVALFQESGQTTLRFLHDTLGVTWMEFTGTVLRFPDGRRYFLCLFRDGGGSWDWNYYWLGRDRDASGVSARLAS